MQSSLPVSSAECSQLPSEQASATLTGVQLPGADVGNHGCCPALWSKETLSFDVMQSVRSHTESSFVASLMVSATPSVVEGVGRVSPTDADGYGSGRQPDKRHGGMRVRVYCGLRVRMGIHSGVGKSALVAENAASKRTTYSGHPMIFTKALADTGTAAGTISFVVRPT